MQNLANLGAILVAVGVSEVFFATFISKIFGTPWLTLGSKAVSHAVEVAAAAMAYLVAISAILYVYELAAGRRSSPRLPVLLVLALGLFSVLTLHSIPGVMLILASLFALLKIEDWRFRVFFCCLSLSLGALGLALLPHVHYYLPTTPAMLFIAGVAALIVGALALYTTKAAEILALSSGIGLAAIATLNLTEISFAADVWRALASAGYLLTALGAIFLIPPAAARSVAVLLEKAEPALPRLCGQPEAPLPGSQPHVVYEEIEVTPFRPVDEDETRVRRRE